MKITIAKKTYTIKSIHDGADLFQILASRKPKLMTYDTETTGLHVMADKPFKGAVCFNNEVYVFDTTYDILRWFPRWCKEVKVLVGHNLPFDLNMTANIIGEEAALESDNFMDTQATVLLASEAVSERRGGIDLKLKKLAVQYIDPNANQYELAVKKWMKKADNDANKILTAMIKGVVISNQEIKYGKTGKPLKPKTYTRTLFDEMLKANELTPELQELYDAWKEDYPPVTYDDVPDEIMLPYLAVDVILTQLLAEKTLPIVVNNNQEKAMEFENKIIPVVVRMARVGLDVDRTYLEESRVRMVAAIEKCYKELWSITEKLGFKFNVGQHPTVKKYYESKGIHLESSDSDHLKKVGDRESQLITRLRTLEKWLSTYIDKILRDSEYDGKFYTLLRPFKAVSGRFSGDAQQFPKFPLKDDDGTIIFESRRAFKGEWVFQDFSQVELRVAGHWTTFFGYDENLCKAYMPYQCKHYVTGIEYDPTNYATRETWKDKRPEFTWEQLDVQMKEAGDNDPRNDSAAVKYGWSVWVDPKTNDYWRQTDLHQATADEAVNYLVTNGHQEIADSHSKKEWRQLGKRANFLLLYQGTVKALMEAIGVDEITAQALYNGFKASFPGLDTYAKMVTKQMNKRGYCVNPFGRRYYLSDPSQFYCIANYMIQGTCAYDLKDKMIRIDDFLMTSGAKTRMVLCVHDEIIFTKVAGEEHIIEQCVAIMEDSSLLNMPLVSEKEVTNTYWSEKCPA